jgi:SpoVK/Ycf46/Vps4 family AAA+-type ATPase
MATAEQIKALVASFVTEDDDRFRAAAKQGKSKLFEELRSLLTESSARNNVHAEPVRPVAIAHPARDLAGLLTVDYPTTRLADMVLDGSLLPELTKIVGKYRQRDLLRANGLGPRRRLLLIGPSGCGKTMTARALAGECRLPLMFVQLHSLITQFMGETAAKLHLVFEAMQQTPGVYLFDEFDALGTGRDTTNDVGRLDACSDRCCSFSSIMTVTGS